MIQYPRYRQHRFSSFQVIIAGFAAVDLVGALLLMLPIAAQQRCVTPFHEALFTSTSALCVTGLVVQDEWHLKSIQPENCRHISDRCKFQRR